LNIALWLAHSAQLYPTRPALLKGETLLANYAQFAEQAAQIGGMLRTDYGIQPGDRVGVFMENRTEYLIVLYAIWWIGAVAVPINTKLHGKEAAWILNHAEARLVFVSAKTGPQILGSEVGLASSVQGLSVDEFEVFSAAEGSGIGDPVQRDDADLAWLFYTSGTTGRPKGVMLSNANLIAMSLCYPIDVDAVSSDDAALYAAPISHGAGLYNFIHVRCGARHVVPESGGFDEDEILDLAAKLQEVSMFAAPTMVKRLVTAAKTRGESGAGIKTIVYGGGPMYLADIEQGLAQLGAKFVQIFGQGESPMTITALSRDLHKDNGHPNYFERLASVGVAQSAVQVRITGPDGQLLPPGEVGEIEVQGATVMLGYWRNPEATADTLRDGWLRTGDMGLLDEDGFLSLRDRSKDVIISGGSNIYPREVEEVLLTHPRVEEVSVIGVTDPEWGEVVVACVVGQLGAVLEDHELDGYCLDAIARFKRPKRYVFMDSLPKNNNGKVMKTELRALLG